MSCYSDDCNCSRHRPDLYGNASPVIPNVIPLSPEAEKELEAIKQFALYGDRADYEAWRAELKAMMIAAHRKYGAKLQ